MKENKNTKFLNCIYKTCEMGVVGINDVIDEVKKEEFREFLQSQKDEYNKVLEQAKDIFTKYGQDEKELGKMVKMSSKMMSEMKLIGKDDSMVAKMMIEGTNKGIIKINKALNEYDGEDNEIIELSKQLIKILENNLNELKIYL